MNAMMSNRQILLVAMALGFFGGFSFVAAANAVAAQAEPASELVYMPSTG